MISGCLIMVLFVSLFVKQLLSKKEGPLDKSLMTLISFYICSGVSIFLYSIILMKVLLQPKIWVEALVSGFCPDNYVNTFQGVNLFAQFLWISISAFKFSADLLFTFEYLRSYSLLKKNFKGKELNMKCLRIVKWSLFGLCFVPYVIWASTIWVNRVFDFPVTSGTEIMQLWFGIISFITVCIFIFTIVSIWRLFSKVKYLRKNEVSMICKVLLSCLTLMSTTILVWQSLKLQDHVFSFNANDYALQLASIEKTEIVVMIQIITEVSVYLFTGLYTWWLTSLDPD
jgi:hypothetical protein